MAFSDWAGGVYRDIQKQGIVRGVSLAAKELQAGYCRRTLPESFGQNVYERDWDVLLILDGCRVDVMEEIQDEYRFVDGVGTHESPGTMSEEWMENTFTDEYRDEISRTAYVTGNPFSASIDGTHFEVFDEVWKYGWDEEYGVVTPETMIDRAIDVWRNRSDSVDRMIVHAMQPHIPFRRSGFHSGFSISPESNDGWDAWSGDESEDVWLRVREGELSYEDVWDAYRDNLRWVMDEVDVFLENADADTVAISSDHGNAIGEKGFWGHPHNMPIDVLKSVPWVETSATDSESYSPEVSREEMDGDVSERLRDLGYME